MVVLNNDRGETGFSVVDTPLRLTPDEVVTWATNNNGLGTTFGDGNLAGGDSDAAAFYPSCTNYTGEPLAYPTLFGHCLAQHSTGTGWLVWLSNAHHVVWCAANNHWVTDLYRSAIAPIVY
jgi:hypothetical protein